MNKTNKSILFNMVMTALLIALKIILERFLSYSVWNQRFGFSFIAVAFAAALLGAPWAALTAGLGDLLGAILFPSGGAYFPGFTLTAVLTALCTAFFIHKNATFPRVVISVLLNQIFGSVLLNSLWISILFGANFKTLVPTRLVQAGVMTVIQITLTFLLFGQHSPVRKRLSRIIAGIH